ncbi:hypothetical protein ZHAS_00004428 [Anopheles sinensis]|uniref:Uncharacterized protein n=1 Tax=Anopheles sinensis TaxID=74873 RepID=A0A084VGX1_ANOSI|nr:hypothetical protein ZHAS_00004428 [Anopheles sinensis]
MAPTAANVNKRGHPPSGQTLGARKYSRASPLWTPALPLAEAKGAEHEPGHTYFTLGHCTTTTDSLRFPYRSIQLQVCKPFQQELYPGNGAVFVDV